LMKEKKKQKALEKEIRALVRERGEQDKKLKALYEDLVKTEAKLSAAVQEKTSLSANVACLKKQLLEITRSNELLKSKLSEDGAQKKMSSLCMELMKLRNMRDAKEKTALAKQEDMEMKLQEVQRNLEHSKGKVVQLQEKLSATEREKVEEKSDTERLLEYITELSQMEETLSKKDQDIEILRNTLKAKEEESCKLMKELNERCQLLQQEKEKELLEAEGQFLRMNAEIEDLKKKIDLVEQEHQKLLQKHQEVISQLQQEKESSASVQQKLLEFEDEVASERHLLEKELNDTVKELNKLHVKEKTAGKLVKQLEQEIKSQDRELAQMKEELKGKNAELEQIKAMHSSALLKIQEEHSNTLQKLGKTIADFESYKKTSGEEICSFKLENTSLREEIVSLKKVGQENLQLLQEAEYSKSKTNEECARMLLEAQTKLALKEAETERTKESYLAQMTKLQEKFEEQTEDLKRELEAERLRKSISEDVTSSLKKEIKTWCKLYEDLHNKVKPFQQQLDAFEAERNALLEKHGAAQEELNKLSDAYAKLLGHQNMKQKIKHVMKLKEDNAHLKQDVSKLRALLAKEKQTNRHLQEQLCAVQGV
ncbi:HMMR protein, partial [Cinclus mexicanus]|nr:HMMR protein [Cinclus mexicanus]